MPRVSTPFVIRKRKDSQKFILSLNESSELPTSIVQKWQRKSFYNFPAALMQHRFPKTLSAAQRGALALIAYLKNDIQKKTINKKSKSNVTLREFLEPYYVKETCPHIARVLGDNGRFSDAWAKSARAYFNNYIFPDPISQRLITDLIPGDFEDLKIRLQKTQLSARSINMAMGAVKTALREGIHRRDINFNPMDCVRRLHETPEETGIFSREEIEKIFEKTDSLELVLKGNKEATSAYVFFLIFALVGERPSAILKLQWMDFKDDILTFNRTKTKINGRAVPVVPAVKSALNALREVSRKNADKDFIFINRDGSPCQRTWYKKRFHTMMDALNLPENDAEGRKRVPYSFKHSLITHLIDEGADEVLVRDYIGHSHGGGTGRILTRVQSTYKHRQAEKMRALLPEIEALYKVPQRFMALVTVSKNCKIPSYRILIA